jgi:hypothetical protein
MQEALLKRYKSKKVEVHHRKGGLGHGPFQKEINLKLGIPNLFLMYSLLMKSGISIHQTKEEKDKDKPILATLSAQKFPSLYI